MVKLTFFGGVSEIGGNKILLEDGGTKVFFDFGHSFTVGAEYFTSWLSPRRITGLRDYFEFGLMPKIEGLYSKSLLKYTDLKYTKPQIDAVFLSHAHVDHVGCISFIDEKIPVYCGYGTKLFLESMEETSGFSNYGEHDYDTFRTGDEIEVGDFVVEPIHVDHSIPAAYGFIIHTPEGEIVYTGDFRKHGPRKDLTEDFIEKARSSEPVALISEGTRMVDEEKRKSYSENQVMKYADEIVSETDKIVFIARYSRDMDRFRTFYKIAKKNSRRIVVSPKTAYLLSKLLDDKHLKLPDPLKDENILVYYKRKKSGCFEEEDYYLWERDFMDKMVNYDFVHKHQRDLMMDLDFYQFTELIDIRPEQESHFIHSMSEPFSEEDIEDWVMHNWLDHFKIRFHQLHASGHISRQQLTDFIKDIKPKTLFPIHTENPQLFKTIIEGVKIPEYGKTYKIN